VYMESLRGITNVAIDSECNVGGSIEPNDKHLQASRTKVSCGPTTDKLGPLANDAIGTNSAGKSWTINKNVDSRG